jgi:hypothetical protein
MPVDETLPPGGELLPPMGYSDVWVWAGIGALGLALLLLAAAIFLARRRPRPPRNQKVAGVSLSDREQALRRVDDVEREYTAGRMSERKAYQELSAVVREYGSKVLGAPIHRLTLSDLRALSLPGTQHVTTLVEGLYPLEFSRKVSGSVGGAAGHARTVIGAWG